MSKVNKLKKEAMNKVNQRSQNTYSLLQNLLLEVFNEI